MGFAGKPDEFQYDTHTDDHVAMFITGIRSHPSECPCPWKDVEVVAKVSIEIFLFCCKIQMK